MIRCENIHVTMQWTVCHFLTTYPHLRARKFVGCENTYMIGCDNIFSYTRIYSHICEYIYDRVREYTCDFAVGLSDVLHAPASANLLLAVVLDVEQLALIYTYMYIYI